MTATRKRGRPPKQEVADALALVREGVPKHAAAAMLGISSAGLSHAIRKALPVYDWKVVVRSRAEFSTRTLRARGNSVKSAIAAIEKQTRDEIVAVVRVKRLAKTGLEFDRKSRKTAARSDTTPPTP